jgi:hypothetical protein
MTLEITFFPDGTWCPVTALNEQDESFGHRSVPVEELVEYAADDVLAS